MRLARESEQIQVFIGGKREIERSSAEENFCQFKKKSASVPEFFCVVVVVVFCADTLIKTGGGGARGKLVNFCKYCV